ncbi:hypothetical protein LN042_22880 [Kitasatospora sp. RB6PN24]|uniref:hypothetical protein n=1 Tax=Kitasatospora humi TaxID=2893891 RepID=UPI001E4C2927|nr:hypothetical protein [Kitasatospora humi]MCC9309880.1 hypothetical protein [Kitasatospora humi]
MNVDRATAEFRFLLPGTLSVVGKSLERIRKGSSDRLSKISGEFFVGEFSSVEFRSFAGEMYGRVAQGGYDRARFRARGALRSLASAMEYAGWGMMAEAVECVQAALREASTAEAC